MKRQLDALRRAVSTPEDQVPLTSVVPVFVPDALATPQWLGPIVAMEVPGLAATWAALMPGQTMLYVTHAMAKRWQRRRRDWREQTLETLDKMTPELATHTFARTDGHVYGLAMQHADGVGPSRLLLEGWLERVFPRGYSCAIPERSVAIVLSNEATARERAQLVAVCKGCHAKGSSPMLPGFFRPDALRPR